MAFGRAHGTCEKLVGALGLEEGDAGVDVDEGRHVGDVALDDGGLGDADVRVGRSGVAVQRRQRYLVKVHHAEALYSVPC